MVLSTATVLLCFSSAAALQVVLPDNMPSKVAAANQDMNKIVHLDSYGNVHAKSMSIIRSDQHADSHDIQTDGNRKFVLSPQGESNLHVDPENDEELSKGSLHEQKSQDEDEPEDKDEDEDEGGKAWKLKINDKNGCLEEDQPTKGKVAMYSCQFSKVVQQWQYIGSWRDGPVQIQGGDGKCLEAVDGKNKNNGNVGMNTCDSNSADQKWEISGKEIKVKGGLCLNAVERTKDGGAVKMNACDTRKKEQQWAPKQQTIPDASATPAPRPTPRPRPKPRPRPRPRGRKRRR